MKSISTYVFDYHPALKSLSSPIIIDSPHSGRFYPEDFHYAPDKQQIRRLEDFKVDELCAGLNKQGAHLLTANLPRSYVDVSRAQTCLSPEDVPDGLSFVQHEFNKLNKRFLEKKTGLIFYRSNINDFDIYTPENKPTEAEIARRLAYWKSYHGRLSRLYDDAQDTFGAVFHLNMHSCWRYNTQGKRRSDIILSDNLGKGCDAQFLAFVKGYCEQSGLEVAVNDPFKGGYIVHEYGAPRQGRHCLQVEIARDLYMDEDKLRLHDGHHEIRNILSRLTENLRGFTQDYRAEKRIQPVRDLSLAMEF